MFNICPLPPPCTCTCSSVKETSCWKFTKIIFALHSFFDLNLRIGYLHVIAVNFSYIFRVLPHFYSLTVAFNFSNYVINHMKFPYVR